MSGYRRPPLPQRVYLDENGTPIHYGRRWGAEGPPAEAYSRTGDLDRFAGLHVVGRALVSWLESEFEVTVDAGEQDDPYPVLGVVDSVEVVRVTPSTTSAAPITFVFTTFPGVALRAGALHDFHFPDCGCDACDDDVVLVADDLERTVQAIVAGRYIESIGDDDPSFPGGVVSHRLTWEDGGYTGGSGRLEDVPADRIRRACATLPVDGRWSAWRRIASHR